MFQPLHDQGELPMATAVQGVVLVTAGAKGGAMVSAGTMRAPRDTNPDMKQISCHSRNTATITLHPP